MGSGLDPTLGAILPLVGVLLGALAAGTAQYLLKRRDERREFRAIARVLAEDMRSTADYITSMAGDQDRLLRFAEDAATSTRRELWDEHALAVARHITDTTEWRTVAHAGERGPAAGWLVAGAMDLPRKRALADDVAGSLRDAAAVLWTYAYPPRRTWPWRGRTG